MDTPVAETLEKDAEKSFLETALEQPNSIGNSSDLIAQIVDVKKHVSNYETFISYEIECRACRSDYPTKLSFVSRRYREFDWLHCRFQQKFPALFIPPLPGKKMMAQFDRYSTDYVDRRTSGLQFFLQKCTNHPVFSSSQELVAFLTFSIPVFHEFIRSHPTQNSILSFLSPGTPSNRSSIVDSPPIEDGAQVEGMLVKDRSLSSIDTLPLSSEFDMKQLLSSSEAFKQFESEVSEYTLLNRRLFNILDKIANQFSALTIDYAELANILEEYPRNGVEDSSARASPNRAVNGRASASCPSTAVGSAVRKSASATNRLAARLASGPRNTWGEAAAFGESIKNVFKRRDSLQNEYLRTHDLILKKLDAVPQPSYSNQVLSSLSKFTLPWNNKPIESLISKAESLQIDLECSNSKIRTEFERWQRDREIDACLGINTLTSAYLEYWTSLSDAWKESVSNLSLPNCVTTVLPSGSSESPLLPDVNDRSDSSDSQAG